MMPASSRHSMKTNSIKGSGFFKKQLKILTEKLFSSKPKDGSIQNFTNKGLSLLEDACTEIQKLEEIIEVQTSELKVANDSVKAAIQEREQRDVELAAFLKRMPIAACMVDQEGNMYYHNNRFIELFGYSRDEISLLDQWWILAYPDEDYRQWVIKNWSENVQRSQESGTDIAADEYKVACKDGTIREMEISGIAVGDRYLATLVDNTERNQINRELEELVNLRTKEHNKLFNVSFDLLCIAGMDGYFKELNPAWEKAMGYSLDELYSRPFNDFIHPDDVEKSISEATAIEGGKTTVNFDNRYITKKGDIIHLSWTAIPVLEEKRMYSIARDVTKQKKAEDKLRASESALEEAQRLSRLGSWIWEVEEDIVKWSKTMYDIVGWDPDKPPPTYEENKQVFEEKSWDQLSQSVEKALKFAEPYDLDLNMVRTDGKLIHTITRGRVVKDEAGQIVRLHGTVQDITERKKAEKQILKYQKRLKDMTQQLTISEEIVRKQIAVDLHDHVGQMLSSSRMQLSRVIEAEENPELMARMKSISQALLNAIQATRNAIFNLSLPELNELGLFAAAENWMKSEVEAKLEIQTSISGADVDINLDEDTRFLVFRSLKELMQNVMKHSRARKMDVKFSRKDQLLEIAIEDNGIGFNYNSELLRLKSNSYGLFSIQERMSGLGGSLTIDSTRGRGTIAKITIPTSQT